VPPETLEKLIRDWITAILGPVPETEMQAVALCGKLQPPAAAICLLAVLAHKTKCVLSQQAVDSKTNEHKSGSRTLEEKRAQGTCHRRR
jgi:hypothetical protein